jgi:hypothetical protein
MAFNHTCKTEIGVCDCGEMIFYRAKNTEQIKDRLYDWVLLGKEWHKLKNCIFKVEWLIDCECVFAHDR